MSHPTNPSERVQLKGVPSEDMETVFEPVVRIIIEMISKQVENAKSGAKTSVTVCVLNICSWIQLH